MRQLFPFAETAAETQVSFSAAFTDESKAAVRRTIKIGRFCRPTTSADKNRPCDIKNRPIFIGRFFSADKTFVGGNPAL